MLSGRVIDDTVNIAQLRELERRISILNSDVNTLRYASGDTNDTTSTLPALNNFLNNTDYIYSDQNYNSSSYTDDEFVLAEWYVKSQASSSAYVKNTTVTESPDSITTSGHSSPSTGAVWETTTGSVLLTGGYKIASKLPSKNANAGSYLAVSMNLARVTGATIASNLKCKVSIFDNTSLTILTGTKPPLTSSKNGSHSGGTVTRQYILEVVMPDGRKFYSDTSSFTTGQNQVVSSVSVINPDSNNTVSISWDRILGASRYNVYRRTPSETDTQWYLISSITNGNPQAIDTGGIGGGVWIIPTFDNDNKEYARAEAFYDDLGSLFTSDNDVNNISLGIRVPSNFVINGEQFVVIEFLKSDYTNTTTTEISTSGLRIDRVGISYTNGRWTPSAKDMSLNPNPTGNPNPLPSGGGSGTNPPSGGAGNTCVEQTTPILVWSDDGNHYYAPANSLVIGDRLVSWNGKNIVPSKIQNVIRGISRNVFILHYKDKEIVSSFSHRYIKDIDDFDSGTRITLALDKVLGICDDFETLTNYSIDSIETMNTLATVITFSLSVRNYIANGIFCHNYKPYMEPE